MEFLKALCLGAKLLTGPQQFENKVLNAHKTKVVRERHEGKPRNRERYIFSEVIWLIMTNVAMITLILQRKPVI